jgi:tetratricopeptide (TPR) repeat protein
MRNAIRAAAVIVAALALHSLCVVPYLANLRLVDIERRTARAQVLDAVQAVPMARTNLRDLARDERAQRLDADWYVLYGANCEILGRYGDAVAIYSQALRIDQRPEIYANRGLAKLQMGRIDAAVNDLAVAARFNPFVLYQLDGDLHTRVAAAAGLH